MNNIYKLGLIGILLSCKQPGVQQNENLNDIDDITIPSNSIEETADEDTSSEDITTDYAFDDNDSLLYIQVFKDQDAAASGLAHDHVMRATNWTGFVSYNPSDIEQCAMQFSIGVQDLQVDEDVMRELVGYGDTISLSDREAIKEHMLAENQLNAAQNPTISFVSSSCELVSEDLLRVNGDMAIRNEIRNWDIDIEFLAQSQSFYMSSVINFTHSDFGIEPYSAFFGAVRNAEPLKITFDMVGYQ
tara:strand:- start:292 stop:1026 length:735 start_codon:yes stop_codon:yes gene_type:complete